MNVKNLLDQVITITLEGRYDEAMLLWSTSRECSPGRCKIKTGGEECHNTCVLLRLLELSLVYDRDRAFLAYKSLKNFTESPEYTDKAARHQT